MQHFRTDIVDKLQNVKKRVIASRDEITAWQSNDCIAIHQR